MAKPVCAGAAHAPVLITALAILFAEGPAIAQQLPPPARRGFVAGHRGDCQAARRRTQADPAEPRRHGLRFQPAGDRNPAAGRPIPEPAPAAGPGVAQDSFGQLHVRGDHANLQFRINGVQLPEGINVFGQALQTRLANSVALITGALPAQYGFRTAGIIDIQTKTGTLDAGRLGDDIWRPAMAWIQPSSNMAARVGQIDYYHDRRISAQHDRDREPDRQLSTRSTTRATSHAASPMSPASSTRQRGSPEFSAPRAANSRSRTSPNLTPGLGLTVNGISDFNSAGLNENQRQINHFAIVTLQKRLGPMDFQLSAFNRYSSVLFLARPARRSAVQRPRPRPPIAAASRPGCRATAAGRSAPDHTLRGRLVPSRASGRLRAPIRWSCRPTRPGRKPATCRSRSSTPAARRVGSTASTLQDEWKIVPTVTVNFGARFDAINGSAHGEPAQPAHQRRVAADDETTTFTRRLFALLHAAAVRAWSAATTIATAWPTRPPRLTSDARTIP